MDAGYRTSLAALTLLAALAAPISPQQRADASAPGDLTTDSADLEAEAREAQTHFERVRRKHLPYNSRWRSGPCDRTIGRLCWRLQDLNRWQPRGEPFVVMTERDSLLARLAWVGDEEPGNDWVLGQRIWYLLEAGHTDRALALARACGSPSTWWCDALQGLVLHRAGWYAEAGVVFDSALSAMGPDRSARWEDIASLVDGGTNDLLRSAGDRSTAARDSLVRRIWHLADPLYLVPGNDRRTEEMARHTAILIRSDGATPHEMAWAEDMSDLVLRYGWEIGWEDVPPRPGELGATQKVVGYEDPDIRDFMPSRDMLEQPLEVRDKGWAPSMYRSARSGYAPAYANAILPMDSHIMLFTRGDRSLVAATYQLPTDTTFRTRKGIRSAHAVPIAFERSPTRAGLFLDMVDQDVVHGWTNSGASRGLLMVEAPAGDYRASVELLDPASGRASVYRNGLAVPRVAPDVMVLSDLVPVEGDSLPTSTVEALRRLRLDDNAVSGQPLVVGWEIWGLGHEPVTVHYRLSLEPTHGGVLGKLGGLLGQEKPAALLEWSEPGPDQPGAAFRSVTLALPRIEDGDYLLRLEATVPGRSPVVSQHTMHVVSSGGG